MSSRETADLSDDDVVTYVCTHCSLRRDQLAAFDFPTCSYVVDGMRYWTPADVRPWIEARARVNVLSIPGELDVLAKIVQSLRRFYGSPELEPHQAREFALSKYASVVADRVLSRSPL